MVAVIGRPRTVTESGNLGGALRFGLLSSIVATGAYAVELFGRASGKAS